MLRGIYKYVCKDCGHKFYGADIELNATVESVPVKCPECGSFHTRMTGLPYPLNTRYVQGFLSRKGEKQK